MVMNMVAAKPVRVGALLACLIGVGGCSEMNSTQQSVLSGGVAGVAVGAIGTVVTGGCVACGAAIGGAVGAGAGYVVDKVRNDKW